MTTRTLPDEPADPFSLEFFSGLSNPNARSSVLVINTRVIMKHILLFILGFSVLTSFGQDGQFHLDKEFAMNSNGTIDLRASDARVFITGSSRKTAHVKINRNVVTKGLSSTKGEFRVVVEEADGGLLIREQKDETTSGIITYRTVEYRIEIAAPEGASLIVRGDDGDYFIKNVNGEISLMVDDADVQLADCKGSRFSLRVDDGNLRMDGGKGELTLEADDADIHISNGHFESIIAEVDDGDLTIETSLSNNGDYVLETEDGTVELRVTQGGGTFSIRHDDTNISFTESFQQVEKDEHFRKLTLAGGNASVRIRADDGSIKLFAGR